MIIYNTISSYRPDPYSLCSLLSPSTIYQSDQSSPPLYPSTSHYRSLYPGGYEPTSPGPQSYPK